jgi:hypothetical protein
MNKLKTFTGTAMAAAVVGTGALASAPSASALPSFVCEKISQQADIYIALANETRGTWPDWLHRYYSRKADETTLFWEAGCT